MSAEINPEYNSLDRLEKWDTETQEIVKQRIANELGDTLSYEFLTGQESEVLEVLVDTLIPQKKNKEYIKISEIIDRDLAKNAKGVRYGENPWPREFYQKGLAQFAGVAKKVHGKPVEDFSKEQLEKYISEIFARNPDDFLRRFLKRVLADTTAIYFSHPASWNAIGFPGPAFPEGYPFLDCGEKENWEPDYEKL